MAKKAQLRVHKLAKELGISSKDVIAKCEAEGIPGIENHLSPVSIGLAATIREWFSKPEDAEESTTAVETAEKVDLDEARKKPRPRRSVVVHVGGRPRPKPNRKRLTNPKRKKPNWSKLALRRPSKPSRLKPRLVPMPTSPAMILPLANPIRTQAPLKARGSQCCCGPPECA